MRAAFGKTIAELAKQDSKLHLVCGDIGFGIFDLFRAQFPQRFHNLGVIEQSMIGIAAGMALDGLHPWVYTITPFLIERPFEQVKLDIDANNVTVKLVGYADYPGQGVSHAEVLDFRKHYPFQYMRVYYPIDSKEARDFILYEYQRPGPCFISLKKDRGCSK